MCAPLSGSVLVLVNSKDYLDLIGSSNGSCRLNSSNSSSKATSCQAVEVDGDLVLTTGPMIEGD